MTTHKVIEREMGRNSGILLIISNTQSGVCILHPVFYSYCDYFCNLCCDALVICLLKMSKQEGLVFSSCVHNGCECRRMFLKSKLDQPQEYVCIKHRRL